MRAMVLREGTYRLLLKDVPARECGTGQVRLRVEACGVCRTDLHIVEGDLKEPALPLIPGHEIVGRVAEIGPDVTTLTFGQRVGVPWLGIPAVNVTIATRAARTFAMHPVLRATP